MYPRRPHIVLFLYLLFLLPLPGNGPLSANWFKVEIYKFVSQFMHIFDFEFENKEAAMKVFSSWSENPSELWTKVTVRPGRTV